MVFVGPHSGHVSRLRQGKAEGRLFSFETSYQAAEFLADNVVPGESIYIKGSMQADHLERLMLYQLDRVVCWREKCGRYYPCVECNRFGVPSPPPFGLQLPGSAMTREFVCGH